MILVTGGMGFIGLHTARSLVDAGHRVAVTRYRVQRAHPFSDRQMERQVIILPLDLQDENAVREALRVHEITSIVHLAHPPRKGLSAQAEMESATMSFLSLVRISAEAKITRVTLGSSLSVYFGLHEGPFSEDTHLPVESTHPVSAAKKCEEVLAAFLNTASDLEIVRARIGIIWGPGYRTFINAPARLCLAALGRSEQFDGHPNPLDAHADDYHDLLYVKDCATALARLHLSSKLTSDVYNVGAGRATRYSDLVEAVNHAVPGANLKLRATSRQPEGSARSYMMIDRLRADAEFEPAFSLQESVDDYVGWLRHNHE
jgi:UDP-glucose 4-epimerase